MPRVSASALAATSGEFRGFEPLTSNYIYCPNQFFDVCLAHHSRGVVRLVSYILRKTLGWLDEDGVPLKQHIAISYREIITSAGVSRGAIRTAVDDAIASGFIIRTQPARPSADRQAGQKGEYMLRWDTGDAYVDDPKSFRGFFGGEGYRTPIPNTFFDRIVPRESLAVAKVVGAVLRHTVGYQNQFGGRRSSAPLSYGFLQSTMNIRDRSTLSDSLRHALDAGYIRCVEAGAFGATGQQQRAAAYAVRWLAEAVEEGSGSKTRPEMVQKPDQFKNPTDTGSETQPADQFKNPTTEKTERKNTTKQQAVAVGDCDVRDLLRKAGFDDVTVGQLATRNPAEIIRQQIAWLERRNAHTNRLGLLRRAIEENWSEPVGDLGVHAVCRERETEEDRKNEVEVQSTATLLRTTKEVQADRIAQWNRLPADLRARYFENAIRRANSTTARNRLIRHRTLGTPTTEVLTLMAAS